MLDKDRVGQANFKGNANDNGEEMEEETYSVIFRALKHPVRRRIMKTLSHRRMNYMDLARDLSIETGHLNYHLDSLSHLVSKDDEGKYSLSVFGTAALHLFSEVEGDAAHGIRQNFKDFAVKLKRWRIAALIGCVIAAVSLASRFVHGIYGLWELGVFAVLAVSLATTVSTKGRVRSVSKFSSAVAGLMLVSLLIAPIIVMNYVPGSLPREYDLSFPSCLSYSLGDYTRAVENSPAFRLFVYQHGGAHLNHFMIHSRSDPQTPPLIVFTYLSSDGYTITLFTQPFHNDLMVRIGERNVHKPMYLSDMGLNLYFQNRLEVISEAGFQPYYQRLLDAYMNVLAGNSGVYKVSGDTTNADGIDINIILDYDMRDISFQISASSKTHGQLFSGELDPFGNIMRLTTFYP
jgi:DNA-binding transcriptional ArsR family regulator